MGSMEGAPRAQRPPNYARIIATDVIARWLAAFALVLAVFGVAQMRGSGLVGILIIVAGIAAIVGVRVYLVVSVRERGVSVLARIISVDWRVSLMANRGKDVWDPGYDRPDYAHVVVRYVFNGREYYTGRDVQRAYAGDLTPGADVEILADPKSPDRFVFAYLS